jgi:hypothetical protein
MPLPAFKAIRFAPPPRALSRAPGMILCLVCLLLASCAAPGDPTPRRPPVPAAITDLSAQQSGDSVILNFALPTKTAEGKPLPQTPQVEIFRAIESGAPSPPHTLLYTIPAEMTGRYVADGRIAFPDSLRAADFAGLAGARLVYSVRTSISKHAASPDSNLAAIQPLPSLAPIAGLAAQVTRTAIDLAWTAPSSTLSGAPVPPLEGYRVYRAEVAAESVATAAADPAAAKLAAPLALLSEAVGSPYHDTQFEFGHTYLYSVRSVARYDPGPAESADSNFVVVAPRDIFPPAAPLALAVLQVPATSAAVAYVELSWNISPEPDVQGYNVYRADAAGETGSLLNPALLPVPVFRDMSAVPGRVYFYSVTAVSRAGIESPRSVPVSFEPPADRGNLQP